MVPVSTILTSRLLPAMAWLSPTNQMRSPNPWPSTLLALMLALARSLPLADGLVRSGQWRDALPRLGTELAGKTLGVIGLGRIGTRVGEMARCALGMNVLAYDPLVQVDHPAPGDITMMKDLRDLLPRVDVLTLHAPLTAQTHHLIGQAELVRMHHSAYLINTSRRRAHCARGAGHRA